MSDLLKWILSILLGGFLGGAISFSWQRRGWLFQQKLRRQTARYETQVNLTREIFNLIDQRIYASRLYLSTINSSNINEMGAEKKFYRDAVAEWNVRISGAIIFTKSAFNDTIAYEIDRYFLPEFSLIDQWLRNVRIVKEKSGSIPKNDIDQIRDRLHIINKNARDLMSKMSDIIYDSKEVIEEKPKIYMSNIDDLRIPYLVKSLFVPRH